MIRLCTAFVLGVLTTTADAACRQALALGLDVSGSVDETEYRLQLDGVAAALISEPVLQALLIESAAPVWVLVYEWSGTQDHALVLPWTEMSDVDAVLTASTVLRTHQRRPTSPSTALGASLETGFTYLSRKPTCWIHTLDISGDGPSNTGPRPQDIAKPPHVIVNGLVIGADDPNIGDHRQTDIKELSSYFKAHVIHGPNAFVETASGFSNYAAAMERKLLRELRVIAIGHVTGQ